MAGEIGVGAVSVTDLIESSRCNVLEIADFDGSRLRYFIPRLEGSAANNEVVYEAGPILIQPRQIFIRTLQLF